MFWAYGNSLILRQFWPSGASRRVYAIPLMASRVVLTLYTVCQSWPVNTNSHSHQCILSWHVDFIAFCRLHLPLEVRLCNTESGCRAKYINSVLFFVCLFVCLFFDCDDLATRKADDYTSVINLLSGNESLCNQQRGGKRYGYIYFRVR